MLRICTICARGGSKGILNKNLVELLGLPLLAHSIRQAQLTGLFSAIAVSSDSDAILDVAKVAGVNVLVKRPAALASDDAAKLPAIRHCVLAAEQYLGTKADIVVDLDATSPLRIPSDIKGAIALLIEHDADNVITGSPSRRSPYFNLVEKNEQGFVKTSKTPHKTIVRRQDSPKTFDMNASIYVWGRQKLFASDSLFQERTALFEMPEERSFDIDSPLDLALVTFIMDKNRDNYTYGTATI